MTGYILELTGVDDALSVEFYVERINVIRFEKKDLIKVFVEDATRYFVYIDADRLGRGHLMCRVEINDKEVYFDRPIVIEGFTGYSIPCLGEGRSISCGDYVVSFTKVKDIPKNTNTHIYAGILKVAVVDYKYITGDMIKELDTVMRPGSHTYDTEEGDRFVVAVPIDSELSVYKDNGVGGETKFETSVMGANGEIITKVDEVDYKIYGEFRILRGPINIYIK